MKKSVSISVLAGCKKAGIDPTSELLKIAKKANVSLGLKVRVYQHLLKYLYPTQKDTDLLEEQERLLHIESMKLLEGLTMQDLRRLANPSVEKEKDS